MMNPQRKLVTSFVLAVAIFAVAGCKKKTAPPLPAAPPPAAAEPTAEITATPSVISAGDTVVLAWRTTNATEVSIEGIGTVPSSGTKSVTPTASTSFHLIARGDGGSADATARVTVNAAPAPVAAEPTDTGNVDEAAFHQHVADVYFDYDSYDVNATAQQILSKDAEYLTAHPGVHVIVGGYCDERGSSEYNLALGENRANSAKQALVNAGISPDRLRVVSFGKEKQFCTEHTEECWQQNRRAGFNVDR